MLEQLENEQAQRVVALDVPSYRQAYSDRMAWLMAYMAELAYLKYDKPSADGQIAVELLTRALKRTKRASVDKVIAAVRRRYDYDHDAKREELSDSLDQIGWTLLDTFSTNATQGFIAYGDRFAALAFRGTEADRIGDIKADAKAVQTTCPTGGRVHSGFKEQYDDVASRVEKLLDREEVKGKPLFIAGHSLGGAVATIAARRLTAAHRVAACYTYGSPRVGTEHWSGRLRRPSTGSSTPRTPSRWCL